MFVPRFCLVGSYYNQFILIRAGIYNQLYWKYEYSVKIIVYEV